MIEENVISLEYALELRELGIIEESSWCWYRHGSDDWQVDPRMATKWGTDEVAAYNTDELLRMIPACIDIGDNEPFNYFWFYLQKRFVQNIRYIAYFQCDTTADPLLFNELFRIHDDKLSDCLAKTLIHIKKNNYEPS